jgi:hypothetical protein
MLGIARKSLLRLTSASFSLRPDPGFQISAEIPDIQGHLFQWFCASRFRD